MLTEKMQDALNEQINAELYSAYLYLSMAAWFQGKALNGFAKWMECQTMEEQWHAMKLYGFVHERGGRVTVKAIDGPPTEWSSPLDVFQEVAKHEAMVTGLINDLVDLAIEDKDHASNNFLQWFVAEQVEEEASADEVVQKLKLVEQAPGGMFMLDQEMGQRTFAVPPEVTLLG